MNDAFRFAYDPGTIVYGDGCVADICEDLAALDASRAMIVTGQTVGSTPEVIEPVRAGVGDRLAVVFDETTPDKTLSTALDGAERVQEADVDALVSLGGGSSLDIAKLIAVTAADRTREDLTATFDEEGTLPVPDGELLPIVAVPTTLAGADLSMGGGITTRDDGRLRTRGGVFDPRLLPAACYYDPALFATTPHGVLCASAMNGFDKAIESLYARSATPITDATATRSLELLTRGLPRLGAGDRDDETLYDAVVGTVLAQYGVSRADGSTLSLIHAFGHGIARGYAIQQGGAHGIIAPHALRYLFQEVDGRRGLLAAALDAEPIEDTDREVAEAVVETVADVRTALGLPSRLRVIEDMQEDDLPDVAVDVAEDALMANLPEGLDPTVDDLEAVLRDAW